MNEGLEALERIIGCSTIESHTKKWQEDYLIVKKEIEVLEILKKAPFILEKLFDNYELTEEMTDKYFYGTITDSEVNKVKEWINK